tara:strand:- start:356 stop:538 length:183 start_codon:yes stop_codon:yes gene_type:complete
MTKQQAIDQLKALFKKYPKCYGNWDELQQESLNEDWDSFKDHLYREGQITTDQYTSWGLL